jgi:hypothetical protein
LEKQRARIAAENELRVQVVLAGMLAVRGRQAAQRNVGVNGRVLNENIERV